MSKKIEPGKKPILIALPVVIALVLIFGITIVFSATSVTKTGPKISNPDDIFLEFGDYKITNEKLYYALRTNYGLAEIYQLVDEALLKDVKVNKDSDEYKEFTNNLIYGVKDLNDLDKTAKQEDILQNWEDTMFVSGYTTKDAREKYIDLEYKREVKAREMYEQKLNEKKASSDKQYAFDASKYQTYYESNYLNKIETIIILFDSKVQAEKVMKNLEINVSSSSTSKGWISTNKDENDKEVALSDLEVQEKFIEMYNDIYQYYGSASLVEGTNYLQKTKTIDDQEVTYIEFDFEEKTNDFSKFVYTTDELTEKDSSIKSKLVSLKLDTFKDSYTALPVAHSNGTNYFLALKINEEKQPTLVFNYDEKTDEEKIPSKELIEEIETKLTEENFNDDVITEMIYELRNNHKLTFYDKVVETSYAKQYDNFYTSTLKREPKSFTAFPTTKKIDKVNILSYELNGETINLSVDQFFEIMSEKYAANAAFNFMNSHIFLTNEEYNKVYNPETKEIYDAKKLREILETVKTYEYYFGMNYFESEGFGKKFGWKNFLKEYFQVEDEKELAVNISVLQEAKGKYAKTLHDYDALKAQMEKIFDDFFSGMVINLIVFIDFDDNGSPDLTDIIEKEFDTDGNWTIDLMEKADELANLVYEKAPSTNETTKALQLQAIVKEYNEATNNDSDWADYKKHGLHLKFETDASYNNTSSIVDEFKDVMRKLYHKIDEAGFMGKTLPTPLPSDPFITSYGYHKIAMVSTTDRTYLNKEENIIFPSKEQVELYEKSLEENNDLTDDEKKEIQKLQTIFTTYYDPAIKLLESDNQINKSLIQLRKSLVESDAFHFINDDIKTRFIEISGIMAKKTEEAIEKENK